VPFREVDEDGADRIDRQRREQHDEQPSDQAPMAFLPRRDDLPLVADHRGWHALILSAGLDGAAAGTVPAMSAQVWQRPFGAVPSPEGGTEFRVWAPAAASVAVRVGGRDHPLELLGDGVHAAVVPAGAGDDYLFVLDGERMLPDPCSRHQPDGIRGPSRVVDTSRFRIAPGPALPLEELLLYELHVGTFTADGTFEAAIPYLRGLRELGVTAVELMPVATFPGARGWGYDGVYIYAPHPAYGGPEALAQFVDAAHREGLGVVLDVVYNHIGPGSEAIGAFGTYFTDAHHTFWGDAIDYSQRGVREWA